MKRSRLRAEDFTVGWVCALPVERAAAEQLLDEQYKDPQHWCNGPFVLGRMGKHNVVIGCLPAGIMGIGAAASVAAQMAAIFQCLQIRLLVGIGGGVPSAEADVRLGDVVISQPNNDHGGVIQYDFGKAGVDGQFKRTGFLNAPPKPLLDAVADLRARIFRRCSRVWEHLTAFGTLSEFTHGNAGPDVLFKADSKHVPGATCDYCEYDMIVHRSQRQDRNPTIHYGTIASGNQVIKDGITRDRRSAELGGVLCFEMEAAGLVNNFPCLTIRGICDYADSHKNKSWQPYAAATAAACAKEILSSVPEADLRKVDRSPAELENLSHLPNAKDAPFNSSSKQHEPKCLEGTRTDLLQEIYSWVDGQDERCIFWLEGLAGTGKSTISRTVARKFFNQDRLAASFFFSRGGGDVGRADKFVSSIAVQLAHTTPALRQHICDAFMERPDIIDLSLRDQWQWLVHGPFSKLDADDCRLPHVLIVDALDECENDNDIRIIVQLLAEARALERVQLRVFLTSRPEAPIRSGFRQMPAGGYHDFVLHSISPRIVDRDISKFLWHELTLISQELLLDTGWPSEEIVSTLVQKASGLFIWASTACRFIRDGFPPEDSLDAILEGSTAAETPEEHLNEIYITVLQKSTQRYRERDKLKLHQFLRDIFGTLVILFSPLSVESLSGILSIQKATVNTAISRFHSILDIPTQQSRPLRLHHPSFRDFLLSHERCKDPNFWVDEKQSHAQLVENCIKLMSHLKQDICDMNASGVLVSHVEMSRVEQRLSPELQYACIYWVQHLQKSGTVLCDEDRVHQFLKEHLLHWLEALGWMRRISDGINAILCLQSLVKVRQLPKGRNVKLILVQNHDCPRISKFIHDMRRFVLYNRSAIEQAPLQAYCSALVFAPTNSVVKAQFQNVVPRWMRRPPKVDRDWNALLQTLEGHVGWVNAIAFSPDGAVLASGSDDWTVRLWDAGTGVLRNTLHDDDDVTAMAFLPDRAMLASGSGDGAIRIWDAATGASRQTLDGDDTVTTIAFSPDGTVLALGSDNGTVRLRDAATGALRQTLLIRGGQVTAIVISPDGAVLAAGSQDGTVRLWSAAIGALQQTLQGCGNSVRVIAFSPNAAVLAVGTYRTVRLWDTVTGAPRQTFVGHEDFVNVLAFSPDGAVLASGSQDSTVRLWNARSGALRETLDSDNMVTAIAFSLDGSVLASGSHGTVRLWDAGTGALQNMLDGHRDCINSVAFSPDGVVLASGSMDRTVRLWDARTGAARQILKGHTGWVRAVAFSPDGALLASASQDRTVRLWDTKTGALRNMLEGHGDHVSSVAFSPDGVVLASGSFDQTVRLWGAATGVPQQTLEGHRAWVSDIAFSPDGVVLASGSLDGTVRLWDATTGAPQQTLEGHGAWVHAVVFSPDGMMLASASVDRTVRLWDTATGAPRHILEIGTIVKRLSFSIDGTFLQTDRGAYAVKSISSEGMPSQHSHTYEIFIEEQWVTWRTERMLWLPPDYRPSCVATHGSVVALGHGSGRLSVMDFAFAA